jgi:hypothetical protein
MQSHRIVLLLLTAQRVHTACLDQPDHCLHEGRSVWHAGPPVVRSLRARQQRIAPMQDSWAHMQWARLSASSHDINANRPSGTPWLQHSRLSRSRGGRGRGRTPKSVAFWAGGTAYTFCGMPPIHVVSLFMKTAAGTRMDLVMGVGAAGRRVEP